MTSPLDPDNFAILAAPGGVLTLEPRPEPSPRPNEAVIEVAYGGVCGSDLHYWKHGAAGESILRGPLVLGHEVVGTVRLAATDGSGPAAGAKVAVHPATPGTPEFRYPADRPNLSGGSYLGSAALVPHTDGAFMRRVALRADMLRPLPEGLDLQAAALAEPAAVAWHAVERAGDLRGKSVLVIGAGPIGSLIVAVAKRAGAAHISVTDLHDFPLTVAQAVGADSALNAPSDEQIARLDADVTFESSGSWRGFASAIAGTARGGKVVMVGLIPSGEQPALLSLIVNRELEILGSFRFNNEIDEVLAALADGSLFVAPIVTHSFVAEDYLEAFSTAADASRSGKVLIDFGRGQRA